MSELKHAFEKARSANNIQLAFNVFIKSKLFILSRWLPDESAPTRYLGRAPRRDRLCVTISEEKTRLEMFPGNVGVPIEGKTLLSELPATQEIVIVYEKGGDYLTKEQLDWMRANLKSA